MGEFSGSFIFSVLLKLRKLVRVGRVADANYLCSLREKGRIVFDIWVYVYGTLLKL